MDDLVANTLRAAAGDDEVETGGTKLLRLGTAVGNPALFEGADDLREEMTLLALVEPRRSAAMAGGVPMMMHITDSPIPLPELLAHMKPGDIVTHCYHGRAHGIMGQEKQLILKEVVEAQRHGIIFDCAHGRNHFSFPMIEKAFDQGFLPDTISTDLTFTSATQGPVFDLPTTMSKLLHFGLPLDEVVIRSTATPAKILGYEGTVGTLKPGSNADIAVFELRGGSFPLRDSDGNTINAQRRLVAQLTIKDGRVWYERPDE